MRLGLVKQAVFHTLRGDIDTIYEGAKNRIETQFLDTFEHIRDEESPPWLQSQGGISIYNCTESDYVSVLTGADNETQFTVDHDAETEAIELPIVAPEKAEEIDITVNPGTSERSQQFRVSIDDSYEYPITLWRTVPVSGDAPTEIEVSVTPQNPHIHPLLDRIQTPDEDEVEAHTQVGLPAVVLEEKQPPIFLISVDALRYDQRDQLQSLIDQLGPRAIVPTEPRTQGTWTPPSHAAMFTGTHPGEHGYVGYGNAPGDKRPMKPSLTTIPELLAANGYKNSAAVSHSRILPEFGFGRGTHRFRHDGMTYSDWITRDSDAKSSVNQLIDWLERDLTVRDHSLFYFLHVFDPHYPYIPPTEWIQEPDIDFQKSERYRGQVADSRGEEWTYLDGYRSESSVDPELVQTMKEWYSHSVEYTANQLARFVQYLKSRGIFEESLIIITGDHGEEFGERGFYTHMSLYDENIRPFMAIKPPAGETYSREKAVDTIDFLPTIAATIGEDVPEHCRGTPLQQRHKGPRITERIYPDWYNVAVEIDGVKGIFTYESPYPDRPRERDLRSGPELEEFYRLSAVRSGDYSGDSVSDNRRRELRDTAKQFIASGTEYDSEQRASRPSQETIQQLQKLGYK
jgi:arylsulfatase A-like enzyme